MTDAQSNYQPEALDKILTADYIEISPVGEFDPREKVLGFYKPELKPPADKMSATTEADEFSIRDYGKFAVVITRLNYTITSEGKPLPPRSIRATFVCRKENGAGKSLRRNTPESDRRKTRRKQIRFPENLFLSKG